MTLANNLIRWGESHRDTMRILLGAFWTATSLFLIVIAIIVFEQQSSESQRKRTESHTVKVACERSRTFGPPFIDFLREAEHHLGIDPLERELKVGGKRVTVLGFYSSTIPQRCPK